MLLFLLFTKSSTSSKVQIMPWDLVLRKLSHLHSKGACSQKKKEKLLGFETKIFTFFFQRRSNRLIK